MGLMGRARAGLVLAAALLPVGNAVAAGARAVRSDAAAAPVPAAPGMMRTASLDRVRAWLGTRTSRLLEVGIASGAVAVVYLEGRRLGTAIATPRGLTWGRTFPARPGVVLSVLVPLARTRMAFVGSTADAFPLAELRPALPDRLVRRIRQRPGHSGFRPGTIFLMRAGWQISGTDDGGAAVYEARPDGSGLRRV